MRKVPTWATSAPKELPRRAVTLIEDRDNDLFFSAVSIWEVAIKSALKAPGFELTPQALRAALLDHGHAEVEIASRHAFEITALPPIHRDPFDRLLIAQAAVEGMTLVTTDGTIARYPGAILQV